MTTRAEPRALRSLTARAPTRIDFGGGWTDVPPYSEERGGCVCNVAIARYATARIAHRDGGPGGEAALAETALAHAAVARSGLSGRVALTLTNDFPVGAGLGGSSAAGVAAVAALAAWRGERPTREALAEESRRVEVEDLGVAGGRQDHYSAAFGGALGLHFAGGDGVRVHRIALDAELASALERRCTVVYSGQSRISGETITAVLDAYRRGEAATVGVLDAMKELAESMVTALGSGSLDELGRLVGEHWRWQRALHTAITTPRIDAIIDAARRAGALGAKALGASGGGCVLVIASEEGAARVRDAVRALGDVLGFVVDREGVVVEGLDEQGLGAGG